MSGVIGLDLSLTSTGVATDGWTAALKPKKLTSYARLRWLRSAVLDVLVEHLPDLLVVEGPSYNSTGGHEHERGGLWWMVLDLVDEAGVPIGVAPPANVKKYATGSGGGPKAGKDAVLLSASRRFEWFAGGNDEADALWLAAMGYQWLGRPIVNMPMVNLTALDKVAWPVGLDAITAQPISLVA